MTRITRLEMRGFKSFANKTELLFGEKFNCILGPNGSGKSNVLDALVFVLGKSGAKGLRAEKTANLIYNGGKTKQPAKDGEVSIFFDNSAKEFGDGFSELKITRTVKEDGSSSYGINGKKVTRQEVVEMLEKARINPDGHNIILQGDIIHLIEMSGIERRQLIEEISGIGVYEDKKEKALRELERVDQKLNETQIVLTEREAYLRELKSDRDQAMKFKKLQDDLKRNKKTILHLKLGKRRRDEENYAKIIGQQREEIQTLSTEIAGLKEEISAHKTEIDQINKEIERRGEKEQVQLHKEVEQLKVDLGVKTARVEQLKGEIAKVKERKESLVKANTDLFDKIKYIQQENTEHQKGVTENQRSLDQIEQRIAEFKKKHSVEDAGRIDQEIAQIDVKADQLNEQLAKLRAEQQELLREKDRIDIRLEQADEKIAKVLEAEKGQKKQLTELKAKQDAFKQATKELQSAFAEDASLAGQISNARGKISTYTEELTKLKAQSSGLRESAGATNAVAKILDQKNKIRGIIGTVAELGTVKKEHQLALEVAAGGRITSLVVEDDRTASECIEFIRKGQHGVATFLPLNKLRAQEADENIRKLKGTGIIGLATDLVDYDRKYDIVFRFVFGNTLVVDTLDNARKLGVGKVRMVTLSGDLVETSGAMQGGFRDKSRMQAGFQQKELSDRIAKLDTELADQESILASVEGKRRQNEQLIERLRVHKADLEGEILTLEKALHIDSKDLELNKDEKSRLAGETKSVEEKIDDLVVHVSTANRELAQLKIRKQQLRDEITALRSPEVLAQLNSFEEKQRSTKDHIAELQGKIRANEAQIKSVFGPEADRIQGILKQQEKEISDFTKEQEFLKSETTNIETVLKEKEAAEKKFMAQFKELFGKRSKASDLIQSLERKSDEKQLRIRELEAKGTNAGMELARVRAEIAGFVEEESQYSGVEPFQEKKEEDCLVEIRQFERMLADIGAVNMRALEIYESVEREYNDLVGKKERLSLERQDVLVMINEIDTKKKDIFMSAFDILNENFKRIFVSLSAKGEAYIEIENEKDIFAGGVAIKVRLSGKKFMDIRSLSGGEKTMTALSFLFAVQEHQPANFYVMDEVDAALDKHNSEKLAKLVRAYCKNAQYLVISHNDSVISEADSLYGVSMNEHGISKVTTLKI